jgi:hypothetical protein
MQPNLVVTCSKIHLRERSGSDEFIQKLIDYRDWELAYTCHGIQSSAVYAEMPGTVFLLHKDCWRRKLAGAMLDDA